MRQRPVSSSQPSESSVPDAHVRRVARLVGGAFLLGLALWVLRSYLAALCWAVIIAISVWPLYRRIEVRLGGSRRAAPLLVTLALAVLVIAPLALALTEIGHEGQTAVEWLTRLQQTGMPVPPWVQNLPVLGRQLDGWWRTHLAQPQSVAELFSGFDIQTLTGWSEVVGGALLSRILGAILTFVALFLLLRDGEQAGERVLNTIDRWFGTPGEQLAETLAQAVRATVNGTILVAVGEGVLIGIGFVAASVPNAALFATLAMAFAMLPMGAWIAFGTAAVVLVLSGGAIIAALAVFAWGAVVMLIGDNIVQPALIGSAVRLPFLWTLLGILGGLETFGLIGLFLGPVVMAALLTMVRQQTRPQAGAP